MNTLVDAIERLTDAPQGYGFSFIPERGDGTSHLPHTELALRTRAMAGVLQDVGLRKGQRIALILPDAEEFLTWFLAAARVGIIPVPMYPPMMMGKLDSYLVHARQILNSSGARFVLTTKKLKLLLGQLQEGAPALESIVSTDKLEGESAPMREERVAPEDLAFLQFTSGSTSTPKGVALSHGALMANIAGISERFRLELGRDMCVSWLPLYHDMGLIGCALTPLRCGGPATLIPPLRFLREPDIWLRTLAKSRATVSIAPNFAYGLCARRVKPDDFDGDLSAWRIAGCGAEPIDPRVLEGFADAFHSKGFRRSSLLPMYGMAEHALAITIPSAADCEMVCAEVDPTKLRDDLQAVSAEDVARNIRLVGCGEVLPGHELAVFAQDDETSEQPLPDDQIGEIRVRGPSMMQGYWNDPEATRRAFAGSYFRTGDLGFLRDGALIVCGRIKELLIINGRNYFPQDIEAVAAAVPGVRKGSVIAFGSSGVWNGTGSAEKLVVALESSAPADLDRGQVITAIQTQIGLAVDELVVLEPGQIPKTSSGKLQRVKTRSLYEQGTLTTQRNAHDATSNGRILKHLILSQASYLKSALAKARPAKSAAEI